MPEYLIFFLMVGIFIILSISFKIPLGLALALAALVGNLLGGEGVSLRHLVEGSFGFFDAILIVVTAIIFLKVLEATGALDSIATALLRAFYRKKIPLLLVSMFLVMLPAMFTGIATTSVFSSGPLVASVLMKLGLPREKTGAFLAMGATLGMIAPPVNIIIMIIGAGVDMPYAGITLPLLLIVVPLAILFSLLLGHRYIKTVSFEEMKRLLPPKLSKKYGFRLYLPLVLVIILMFGQGFLAKFISALGIPAVFLLGSAMGIFCGRPFHFLKITQQAIREAMPLLALLAGVGMFIQSMTLNGSRGWLVVTSLSLPATLLYLGIAIFMPVFGGISAFGSASILGVPFLLALIGKNAAITSSALSAIAGIGNILPPTAIEARFAAQVVGEKSFFPVLRSSLLPCVLELAMGIGFLLLAPFLDKFF